MTLPGENFRRRALILRRELTPFVKIGVGFPCLGTGFRGACYGSAAPLSECGASKRSRTAMCGLRVLAPSTNSPRFTSPCNMKRAMTLLGSRGHARRTDGHVASGRSVRSLDRSHIYEYMGATTLIATELRGLRQQGTEVGFGR